MNKLISIRNRVIKEGQYLINNKDTVRGAAKVFNVSKSTIYNDVTNKLKSIDTKEYEEVKMVLEINKKERSMRGGLATRAKYLKLRMNKYSNV